MTKSYQLQKGKKKLVVLLFELPVENAKHLNFEWRRSGVGCGLFCSEVTLFEYNVSIILSPIDIYD